MKNNKLYITQTGGGRGGDGRKRLTLNDTSVQA